MQQKVNYNEKYEKYLNLRILKKQNENKIWKYFQKGKQFVCF